MKRLSLLIVFMHIAFSIMSQEIYESRFAFGSSVEKDYISNVLYSDLDNSSFYNTRKNLLDPISRKTKFITSPKQYDAFVIANFAYSIAPQSSIGFTIGMYRTWGWFVSIATDTDSDFPKYTKTDEDGTSDYYFTGSKSTSRFSVQGGVMYKINYLLAAKLGAGYGNRKVAYRTMENEYIGIDNETFKGMELSAGIYLSLKETVFSLDISTVGFSFKYSEIKLGLGYGFKIKGRRLRKEIKI